MKRLIFLAAALAAAAPAEAKRRELPPYPEALRCAALTGAVMKRGGGPIDSESIEKFDYALYWGLVASDAARKAKLTAAAFEAEMTKAVDGASAEIAGGAPGVLRELDRCEHEVPPLKGRKG